MKNTESFSFIIQGLVVPALSFQGLGVSTISFPEGWMSLPLFFQVRGFSPSTLPKAVVPPLSSWNLRLTPFTSHKLVLFFLISLKLVVPDLFSWRLGIFLYLFRNWGFLNLLFLNTLDLLYIFSKAEVPALHFLSKSWGFHSLFSQIFEVSLPPSQMLGSPLFCPTKAGGPFSFSWGWGLFLCLPKVWGFTSSVLLETGSSCCNIQRAGSSPLYSLWDLKVFHKSSLKLRFSFFVLSRVGSLSFYSPENCGSLHFIF